jgi:hypothetical protein
MATRRAGSRAFRPDPLMLETRRVLSAVVRGVDVDGDTWVLRLIGPGDLRVENQPDADDNFVPVGEPGLISQITIGGTSRWHRASKGESNRRAAATARSSSRT